MNKPSLARARGMPSYRPGSLALAHLGLIERPNRAPRTCTFGKDIFKRQISKQILQSSNVLHQTLPSKNLLENNNLQTIHIRNRFHSSRCSNLPPRRRRIRHLGTKLYPNSHIQHKRRRRQLHLSLPIPKPKRPIHRRISLYNDPLRHWHYGIPNHLSEHKIRLQTSPSLHHVTCRLGLYNSSLLTPGSHLLRSNALTNAQLARLQQQNAVNTYRRLQQDSIHVNVTFAMPPRIGTVIPQGNMYSA